MTVRNYFGVEEKHVKNKNVCIYCFFRLTVFVLARFNSGADSAAAGINNSRRGLEINPPSWDAIIEKTPNISTLMSSKKR